MVDRQRHRIIAFLIALVSIPVTVLGTYPFIDDFIPYGQSGWQGTSYKDIIISDKGVVTLVWDAKLFDTVHDPDHQLYYRQFNESGADMTPTIMLSDSTKYRMMGSIHVGQNHRGKWMVVDNVQWFSPPNYQLQLRAWISNDEGRMVDTGIVVGEELLLDGSSWNPVGALDSAGNFAVAWARTPTDSQTAIWCQVFNADKTPRTGMIKVSRDSTPSGDVVTDSRIPQIAMTPGGDFVVAWQAYCGRSCPPNNGNPDVLVRLYRQDGTPTTDQICATCDDDSSLWFKIAGEYPDITIANNGDFTIVGSTYGYPCQNPYNVYVGLRRFHADGTSKGHMVVVDSLFCDTEIPLLAPYIDSDSAGNLIVCWQHIPYYYADYTNILTRRYNSDGDPVGTAIRINNYTDHAYVFISAVGINNSGLCGFYWGGKDMSNASQDFVQLMDYQEVGFYVAGDANNDHQVNVSDAVYLIGYIFAGGQAPVDVCLGDANGDATVNISDAVTLIGYIFGGGSIGGHCPS